MHQKKIISRGEDLSKANKLLIMVHGRGGDAGDILSLASHLDVDGYALLAPQATGHSWYPQSFLAPVQFNEPWLSSALQVLKETVQQGVDNGIAMDQIYFLGFSQGACLALEFVARNANRYGGVVALTGGLIGEKINRQNYKGDFARTPVFIGTSDPDAHVPVERVYATANILRDMGADVTEKVYPNMGHTINQSELHLANELVFGSRKTAAPGL